MINWPIHKFCQIAKCQTAFFGITVNFIIQKLKSKHLFVSVFSGDRFFFEGTRENIFTHIPGLIPQWWILGFQKEIKKKIKKKKKF